MQIVSGSLRVIDVSAIDNHHDPKLNPIDWEIWPNPNYYKETNMNDNTEHDTDQAFVHEGFTDEELTRLNQEMTEAHLVPFQDPGENAIRVQTDEEVETV